jgi:hypothetical protein
MILLNISIIFEQRKETKKWAHRIGRIGIWRQKEHSMQKLSLELTDHKRQLFQDKVAQRTRHFSLALEDMMKSQNASALDAHRGCLWNT